MDDQLLTGITLQYMYSEVCVRVNSVTTKPFRVSVEIRKSFFSLILFLIYVDKIVKTNESGNGLTMGDCLVYTVCYSIFR